MQNIKEIRRKNRIDRIKLQIQLLELESRVEQAYSSGDPSLRPFITEAEKMIRKGRDMLENTRIK